MIGFIFASWLLAAASAAATGEIDGTPTLNIDPCVAVDETLVRKVIALELHDAHAGERRLPDSLTVRCVGEGQEIRLEPWASTAPEGIRTIQLSPAADDADGPARQARSRELALAMAEFIRRFEIVQPPAPKKEEPPPAPVPPPPPVEPPTPSLQRTWEIGLLSRWERFSEGQNLVGGDLFANLRLGSWFLAEVHGGGRWGQDVSLPQGRLSARAAAVGAGLGVHRLLSNGRFDAAVVLQAQWYLIQFRAEQPSDDGAQSALLAVCTLAAEPRLAVVLTRHFRLDVSAGVGTGIRGVMVRVRGSEMKSPSGLVFSGALGAGVTF